MKKILLGVSAVLLLAAGCTITPASTSQLPSPSSSLSSSSPIFDGIAIKGDSDCIQKTKTALALLQKKSPSSYKDVKRYIGVIECTDKNSGMYANENPPRFQAGKTTRDAGAIWYAGAIVHDANHSKLYHQYLVAHPNQPVPADVWIGKTAESQCISAQVTALKDIGADDKTIQYTKNSINSNYWEDPDRKW